MSETAIYDTTMALRRRIREATGAASVHVGPPIRAEMGDATIALFLFHIQPSAELRNTPRYAPAPPGSPPSGAAAPIDAVALDLRYLIVCHRGEDQGGAGGPEPGELEALGRIVASLHGNPILSGASLTGQRVSVTPDRFSADDLNRVWSLLPDEPLRTAVAYLATPVYVELGRSDLGPPVQLRRADMGLAAEPPSAAEVEAA